MQPVVLFGYRSSPFTQKIQLALRLQQIPYTLILVSSMMPRPVLADSFNLTYRKIPVLAIGTEVYIDTSLILEVLHQHSASLSTATTALPALHPDARSRTLTRLLSSHYTDRPLFRLTTGLIPGAVWRTNFGTDRAELIGHTLDADKLAQKVPRNLAGLDTFLSILEPLFSESGGWVLGTQQPTAADLSLFYQLEWGEKISRGEGVGDLTGGEAQEGPGAGMRAVFNRERYPGLFGWFVRLRGYVDSFACLEEVVGRDDKTKIAEVVARLDAAERKEVVELLPTPAGCLRELDERNGLAVGVRVSVAPDDTGRDNPTLGTVVALSAEEVVITPDPIEGRSPRVRDVRLHFPRVGFVVRPVGTVRAKL